MNTQPQPSMKIEIVMRVEADPYHDSDDYDMSDERRESLARGDWHFVGVLARAVIYIPHGKRTIVASIESPGLWGIDSNSGKEYFHSVFLEEVETLKTMILAMQRSVPDFVVIKS